MWKVLAIVVYITGSLISAFVPLPVPVVVAQIIWLIVVVTIYFWSARMFLRGKRHEVPSAEEVMALDPRPPVIYMRSFKDDPAAAQIMAGAQIGWAFIFGALDTEEEMLAKVLHNFGPMISIGKPGEELPELGAARMYVSEAEWHAKVEHLMKGASLVVLRLGQTEGFWWELEQSIRQINPHELIVLVPYIRNPQARIAIRSRVDALFPKKLPEWTRADKKLAAQVGTLRGYLYFDPDWTAHYVDLTRKQWTWKTLPRFLGFAKARATLTYALRPVFQQLNVPWPEPSIRWAATIFASAIFGGLALLFLFIVIMSIFSR